MSEGYYDPHPLLVLDQPLVLVGHPGAGAAGVARMVSGRTGLTFSHVERICESLAGRSRARIVIESGLEELNDFEGRALDQAIRRRPFGIVSMESGLLLDPVRRRFMGEQSTVVYIRRPYEILLARIRKAREGAPGSLPEFLVAAPRRAEDLREYLDLRERALSEIDVVVEAEDRHASQVADDILSSLSHLLGVARPGEHS